MLLLDAILPYLKDKSLVRVRVFKLSVRSLPVNYIHS